MFPRTAKSIPLSPQVRAALDVAARRSTPNELIRAILRAPVDLLWNGGIGTYVKASAETHADAGDKANDARARERRASCAAGSSARAATSASPSARGSSTRSTAGASTPTRSTTRAASTAPTTRSTSRSCSTRWSPSGDLTVKQRNELLAEMTETVAALVLQGQLRADRDAVAGRGAGGRHARRARALHARPRAVAQARPRARGAADDEEIAERKPRGPRADPARAGGRARLQQDRPVRASCSTPTCPRTPTCRASSSATSPRRCPSASATQMRAHRLRREIIATQVVNNMLHGGGTTFAFRLHEETGAPGVRHRPRVRGRARGVRDAPAVGRDRGARQQGRRRRPDRRCCSRAAGWSSAATRWLLRTAAGRSTSPRPCTSSRPARPRSTRRCRGCSARPTASR